MSSPPKPSPHDSPAGENEQTASGGREVAAKPQAPRLSILHLMLWMLGSAVILAVWRALDTASDDTSTSFRIFRQVMHALQSMLYGCAIGGLALVFLYRRRGLPYPYEPGHWLLLISGLMFVNSITWHAIIRLLFDGQSYGSESTAYTVHMLSFIARSWMHAIVIGVAAIFVRKSPVWLVVFLILVGTDLLQGASSAANWVAIRNQSYGVSRLLDYSFIATWTIAGIAVAVAATIDLAQRNRRDWAHWTGVSVLVFGAVLACSWQIGIWVIFEIFGAF